VDQHRVIRENRDTLYSPAVCDLEASDVTVRLPDVGDRFLSLQVIDQEHDTPRRRLRTRTHVVTTSSVDTRDVAPLIRTLVDAEDPDDVRRVNEIQDAVSLEVRARQSVFLSVEVIRHRASRARGPRPLNRQRAGTPRARRVCSSHLLG
jgi:uncharacterized protein DUF1254